MRNLHKWATIVIDNATTHHARYVVYTVGMNRKWHLITVFIVGLGLLATDVWAQAADDAAATENTDDGDTAETAEDAPAKIPQRLSSRIARSTITADRKRHMMLLAEQLPSGKPYWLNDGENDFLAVWQEDRSGDAQGALLILHAEGEHPSWPQTTQPLHDSLPEYGWATMAIQLPDPLGKQLPRRTLAAKSVIKPINRDIVNEETEENNQEKPETNDTQNNSENDTSTKNPKANAVSPQPLDDTQHTRPIKTASDIENIAAQRLTAAIKFLHDKGQFNIVLMGNGTGAIRGHELMREIVPIIDDVKLKKKIEKPIRGSIIFNAKNTLPTSEKIYEDWFFDPEIPVLDIYMGGNIEYKKEARVRKAMARRKKAVAYKQIALAELSYEKSWRENRLSRRIRSFLDAYIQGIEVENATLKKAQQ